MSSTSLFSNAVFKNILITIEHRVHPAKKKILMFSKGNAFILL